MDDFLQRLKQRKLVQWTVAYLAAAWVILQVLDLAAGSYHWPDAVMHIAFGVLAIGLVVVLVLAWYHGERGEQRASGMELLLVALVLAVGGGLLWNVSRAPLTTGAANHAVAQRPTASTGVLPPSATSALPISAPLPPRPIPAKSVAVLPFENLSTDKSNAYFADGMQDLILTKLADIGDLKVISRTSTMQYGSHPEDLTKIGERLGVAAILEGSVQKAGKQVLINVQLIDTSSDSHIWADSYTRTLDNIFGVEGEVAEKVATALNAKLTKTEQHEIAHLPTTNPGAYTLYLKAVHEINQFFAGDEKPEDVKLAVAYLQHAVDMDPEFALAYALLARAQGDLQFNDIENNAALARSELANAQKAVALQPNLAEAHDYLAVAYGANGMRDKVIPELETALRLDPTNLQTRVHLAVNLERRGDWDGAQAVMAPALRMNPTDPLAYLRVAENDMSRGRYAMAQTTLDQGFAIAPSSQGLIGDQAALFILLGEPHQALQWSAKLSTTDGTRQSLEYAAYMQLHQFAQALSTAQSIPDSNNDLAAAGKELMIATAAQFTGNQMLARNALAKARHSIEPYLRSSNAGTSMALSHRMQAFGMLAEIEKLSGHREAATSTSRKLQAMSPSSHLAVSTQTGFLEHTAEIAAYFGDAKEAVDALQKVLSAQGTGADISVGTLKLDPTWDPIRKNPAFQALLKKYTRPTPVAASTTAAAAMASSATRHN